jgi:hypothetical protein
VELLLRALYSVEWDFWKAPGRKLYAVDMQQKRRKRCLDADDSDDDFLPPRKTRSASGEERTLETLTESMEEVKRNGT